MMITNWPASSGLPANDRVRQGMPEQVGNDSGDSRQAAYSPCLAYSDLRTRWSNCPTLKRPLGPGQKNRHYPHWQETCESMNSYKSRKRTVRRTCGMFLVISPSFVFKYSLHSLWCPASLAATKFHSLQVGLFTAICSRTNFAHPLPRQIIMTLV